MALKQSAAAANAAVNAKCALVDGGTLKIYSVGSGVPVNVADEITDQTLLASLALSNPAFGAAAAGEADAAPITSAAGVGAGDAAFFRLCAPGGSAVMQGSVGTEGADLILNNISIAVGGTVGVTSLKVSESLV